LDLLNTRAKARTPWKQRRGLSPRTRSVSYCSRYPGTMHVPNTAMSHVYVQLSLPADKGLLSWSCNVVTNSIESKSQQITSNLHQPRTKQKSAWGIHHFCKACYPCPCLTHVLIASVQITAEEDTNNEHNAVCPPPPIFPGVAGARVSPLCAYHHLVVHSKHWGSGVVCARA